MSEPESNVKQGAVIGGWVCFGLGLGIMAYSLWLVPVYGALLFAAFILSIVAMSQKRIAGGLVLLLGCVTLGPGLWLYLTLTKSARALNKAADYVEQDNLKHGIGIRTRAAPIPMQTATPRAPSSSIVSTVTSVPHAPEQSTSAADAKVVYNDNLANAEAASIGILSSKRLDGPATLSRPRPCFSADGRTVLYARVNNGGSTGLVVRALDTGDVLKTFTSPHQVRTMAWSPDGQKVIFFDGDRNLYVADLANQSDSSLPFSSSHVAGDEPMLWRKEAVLIFTNEAFYGLNLDDLSITQHPYNSREHRDVEIAHIAATAIDHPRCTVYKQQIQNHGAYVGDYLFVANKDFSYAHSLASGFNSPCEIAVSPDLRHVLVSREQGLTLYYLGVQKRPQTSYSIEPLTRSTNAEGNQLFAKCLNQGVPFHGTIYPPQTNPLNGKVIGPNRKVPKGWMRVTRWLPQAVLLETVLDVSGFNSGDVVADLASDSINENGYHTAGFEDQWRQLTVSSGNIVAQVPTVGNKYFVGRPDESVHDPGAFSYILREEKHAPTVNTPQTQAPAAIGTPGKTVASKSETANNAPSGVSTSPTAENETPATSLNPLPGERFPETRSRLLTASEIQGWSEAKLQYAINEIFARHGADFRDKAVTKWFSQFRWYNPKPGASYDDVEGSLSDIERGNVQLLGTYRNAKKGNPKQRRQGRRNPATRQNQNQPQQPNPVAERLIQSILRGVQQGLENHR